MFSIICSKNQNTNLWCFDYTFENGFSVVEEPLMHQATKLIDSILFEAHGKIPEEISIYFDALYLYEPDVVIKLVAHSETGSVYRSSQVLNRKENYEHDVWLCPVLTDFFAEPPKELYILITPIVK